MILDYYIVNPTGNITALVLGKVEEKHYKNISHAVMRNNPEVEQVGFVDFSGEMPKLHMAGGEFCGNATISTAALYCKLNGIKHAGITVSVYGTKEPVLVDVKGENDSFSGEGNFLKATLSGKKSFNVEGKKYSLPVVTLPGISHIIADDGLKHEIAEKILRKYSKELNCPATGIMIFNREDGSLLPIVYVEECDTLIYENSCVSGSIAVASYLLSEDSAVDLELKQPGGIIKIAASDDEPKIKIFANAVIEKHIKEEFDYE